MAAIVEFMLGTNLIETEENSQGIKNHHSQGQAHLNKALKLFT